MERGLDQVALCSRTALDPHLNFLRLGRVICQQRLSSGSLNGDRFFWPSAIFIPGRFVSLSISFPEKKKKKKEKR